MGRSYTHHFKVVVIAVLCVCYVLLIVDTWHWPLAGDAALMHYVAYLSDHGFLPYVTIDDVNFPMAYLPDYMVQHLFGPSALAWRIYDLLLGLLTGICCAQLLTVKRRFAVLWTTLLFVLIHGRDGIEQAGQRDLAATPLLVLAIALILHGQQQQEKEQNRARRWGVAGFLLALAISIKPVLGVFLLVPPLFIVLLPWEEVRKYLQRFRSYCFGILIVMSMEGLWLWRMGALADFFEAEEHLATFHAGLGHVHTAVLLHHAISPISILVLLAVLITARDWKAHREVCPLDLIVLLSCCAGFASFVLQHKGFSYHRYPLLVFLLIFVASTFSRALSTQGWRMVLACGGLAWSCLVLAPASVWKAAHYGDPEQEVTAQLPEDLSNAAQALHLRSLSGQVQCLDSVNGCVETLERLQLVQSTGHLYDEFLFNTPTNYTLEYRAALLKSFAVHPPAIIVVMANLFPAGPTNYSKLDRWPEFENWLQENYSLYTQRVPNRRVRSIGGYYVPPGYRIYIHRR